VDKYAFNLFKNFQYNIIQSLIIYNIYQHMMQIIQNIYNRYRYIFKKKKKFKDVTMNNFNVMAFISFLNYANKTSVEVILGNN